MTDAEREFVIEKGLQIMQSLMVAVEKSGGNPMIVCNIERLSNQTALQFLSHISVNDVVFTYLPKNK